MAIQSPQELFLYNLGAMYDIEQNLAQVLPELARECQNPQVKQAFQEHEQQTRQHVRNLEQCFQILGRQPISLNNQTVAGLKRDHDAFVQQQPQQQVLDMFDLEAGYESEYIEVAKYNALIEAARNMGLHQCIPLFEQNMQQDADAAKKLGTLIHQFSQQPQQA
jgi:ferritin-like metal-binding protein YciE